MKTQVKKYKNFEIYIIPTLNLLDNYIFLIKCLKSDKTICVDPGNFKDIDGFLQEQGWRLDYIIVTHRHWDHINGVDELREKYDCQVVVFEGDSSVIQGDIFIDLEAELKLGEVSFTPFATFGHCSNHVSYFIAEEHLLFCGDTLFSSGCGRVFADGSYEELHESLNKIKDLPIDTQIYCAHEYTLSNIDFALSLESKNKDLLLKKKDSQRLRDEGLPTIPTTLENELKTNPFLRSSNKELRASLDAEDLSDLEVFKLTRKAKDRF